MGILDRLRNVFGRGRTVPAARAEEPVAASAAEPTIPAPAAEPAPAASAPAVSVPAPAEEPSPSTVDELVSAAFDNPTLGSASVPAPATSAETAPAADPEPAAEVEDDSNRFAPDSEDIAGEAQGDEPAVAPAETPAAAETEPLLVTDTQPAREEQPEPAEAAEPAATATAATAATTATTAEEEPPTPAGKPAFTPARLKAKAPTLAAAYKAAGAALKKHELTGVRADVYLVLDRSGSMRPYFKDGSAQNLAEQVLALSAHTDETATVDVVFFSTELDGTGTITLDEYESRIDELHAGLGRMGRTNYDRAIAEIVALHEKADDPDRPALVIFQTDGAPESKTAATDALKAAAEHKIFWQFVAFGDTDSKAFDYLRKLDLPNTGFFHAGPVPNELTDTELYKGLLADWRP